MLKSLKKIFNKSSRKNLYLHIGMPKTGSSAIQAFLALNQDFLKKHDFIYPNHTGFKQAFQTSAGNVAEMRMWIKNGNKRKLELLINNCSEKNIILSSEILFVALKTDPKAFAKYFSDYNIKIICFIRKMSDLIESCINQQVKNHYLVNHQKIDKIINNFNYYECLLSAKDEISTDKFIIKKYKNNQNHVNIYQDFFKIFSIELDDTVVLPEKHVNPSFNRDALEFRLILNKSFFGRDDIKIKYGINGLLAKYSISQNNNKKYMLISTQKRQEMKQLFAKPEKQLIHHFFNDTSLELFTDKDEITDEYKGLTSEKIKQIIDFIKDNDQKLYNYLIDFINNQLKNNNDRIKILQAVELLDNKKK